MNSEQVNKINMYQATQLVLTTPAHQALWSALPAFVRGQASHTGSLNILAALAQSQSQPLTGITVDKDRLQRSVINRLLIVAGAAGVYAFEAGNETLVAKFAVKEGALQNTRDALLDDIAQGIHDEAATLVTAQPAKLLEYGLTPVLLTALQSAITAYSAAVGTPRSAIAGRTATTQAILTEIARADDNLERVLDPLIRQFAADHRAFVDTYHAARKVIDLSGTGPAEDTADGTAGNPTTASPGK